MLHQNIETSKHRHITTSPHRHIETSRHQNIETSKHHDIGTSKHRHIETSKLHDIETSPHQNIDTSKHRHITTSPHRHIETSPHRHIETSAHRNIGTSKHRHIETSPHRHIETSPHRNIDTSKHRHITTSPHRHIETSRHRHIETSKHRNITTSAHRHIETSAHRHIETLPHKKFSIMAYRNFKLIDLEIEFGITVERQSFFDVKKIKQVMPSALLLEILKRNKQIAFDSSKSLWAYIALPILSEVKINNKKHIAFYFDEMLSVSDDKRLNGKVDFIFLQKTTDPKILLPTMYINNLKPNEDLVKGIAELAAQMVGGQLNNQKHKYKQHIVYGAVVSEISWMFLELNQNTLSIDSHIYYLDSLLTLLGIFNHLLKPQPLI